METAELTVFEVYRKQDFLILSVENFLMKGC